MIVTVIIGVTRKMIHLTLFRRASKLSLLLLSSSALSLALPAKAIDYTVSTATTDTNGANGANGRSVGDNDSITITTEGSVTVTGVSEEGIDAVGSNTSVVNNGTITTSGEDGFGIKSEGANNNSVNNTGTITTTGDQGEGVYWRNTNGTFENTGTISTAGKNANGLDLLKRAPAQH